MKDTVLNLLLKFVINVTISSLFSIIGIKEGIIRSSDVTIFPYALLIITYILFFSPFMGNFTPKASQIVQDLPKIYKYFAYFYIACSFLSIYTYLPNIRSLISSGQWANNYRALLAGELIFPDSSPFLHFATLVSGYSKVLAIILAFSMKKKKKKNILSLLLLFGATGRTVCSAIFISSRGALVAYGILLFGIFSFFFPEIGKSKKFLIGALLTWGILLIIPFFIQVTVDRFRTGNAFTSIIDYLGKAPVVFNYGVYTSDKIAWGKYAWGALFGIPFSPSDIGGKWGTSFYTFAGLIHIDWGTIGLICVSGMVALFWRQYEQREVWNISDLFLLFMHFSFLLDGVFVIGRDYCYIVIVTLVIYVITKVFFEKYHYNIGDLRI